MVVMTRAELMKLNEAELSGAFARICREVSDAEPGSREWQDAAMSLANIRHEQARRRAPLRPRPRGPGF